MNPAAKIKKKLPTNLLEDSENGGERWGQNRFGKLLLPDREVGCGERGVLGPKESPSGLPLSVSADVGHESL